ncbi:ABC transporter substrate-binding protein [Frigoribacterium faeni]|uniref:ABC transporter substrate-binding protein n=1 Tax=Frigoribacterium faeni TaxID=145483 RepID=A0A7W3PJ86_9MICO|nr:ABC transporter substrate-binding protein [Frigoribacterium faeni]MBA8813509.1 peptide/nickel transport system substrate-binding protein [Frigoribacterium faeni]BFF14766.1 ABC transporter substrate-binding protein [Microbacterium flavescens]GEK82773.1 ABC transporter substrate-binding protein [Frigoribacterium faeni]
MSRSPFLRRRALALPAAALGLVLAVTGCQAVQTTETSDASRDDVSTAAIGDQTIVEGGDLVMALSAEPDRLDPTTSSSLYTRYVMETMCQKLYDIDADGQIVPMLATELPTVSDDGLTVSFPVRTDAEFADGTPLDAAAVVTTLQRGLDKDDSSRRSELGPITDITAVDDETVEIDYSEPFAPLTAALADRAGMVMSPTALEAEGDDFGDAPVCVGPFKFVERVPQTSITVERDPLYYDAENVHFDTITYRIITDASIRAANLQSGDVQVADSMSTQDVESLKADDALTVLEVGSLGYQGLTVNIGNQDGVGTDPVQIDTPLASDATVRQALSMSIDREALVASIFGGLYDPACSPISPDSPFATDASDACPEYDPEAAKQLLEDAGVETPLAIDMQVSNNPDTVRFAQALQAQVADGGFDLTITPVEYSTLLDVQTRGDFEALQLGWSGRVDPHGNTYNFLSTGGGNNYSGYSSDEVDDLLTRAAATNDVEERADLYGQAVAQVQEDDPIIYLYRVRSLTALSNEIAGVSTYADGVVRLSNAAFVEAS